MDWAIAAGTASSEAKSRKVKGEKGEWFIEGKTRIKEQGSRTKGRDKGLKGYLISVVSQCFSGFENPKRDY